MQLFKTAAIFRRIRLLRILGGILRNIIDDGREQLERGAVMFEVSGEYLPSGVNVIMKDVV